MNLIAFIFVCIAAYLLGAVPFGLVYAKMRGVDIRQIGSGNIGATNVSRQFGFLGGFVPVFILDFLKGGLPVLAVRLIGVEGLNLDIAMIITGVMAMMGHIFPVYLGFKGGKGVATAAGVFMMIAPAEVGLCLAVFIFVLLLARFIGILQAKEKLSPKALFSGLTKRLWVASVVAGIALPVFTFTFSRERIALDVISILLALLLIFSHRKNFAQAFAKTEPK